MECKKDGQEKILPAAITRCKIGRKRRAGEEGRLQLAFTTSVPYSLSTQAMHFNQVSNHTANFPATITYPKSFHPFMNNMDEITYWVFTKRAPCLLNYDNLIRTKNELAHCSKAAPISISSDKPTPKKKRKIEILDDTSISSEKQQNIFFETPQHPNEKTGKLSCRSGSQGSNIGFNIRDSATKSKTKPQKKSKVIQKKNKVITSTPKASNVRRSLRNTHQNNSYLNNSLQIFDSSIVNGNEGKEMKVNENNNKEQIVDEKNEVPVNGQFEDISDVSGFTANYIRSTKLHSSKLSKSRNKSRPLKDNTEPEKEKIVMCVNKAVNTEVPRAILNCTTDSSQNIINLVTVKNNESANKIDKSTSLLKFINPKSDKSRKTSKTKSGNNLNISIQSKSSKVSRYPKRQNVSSKNSKSQNYVNQIERSEKLPSRTRRRRKLGLDNDETACSVVQLNSTEVSTPVAVNVADVTKKSKKSITKCRKKRNKNQAKDSFSDTSDFKINKSQDSSVKRLTRNQSRTTLNLRQSSQRDSLRNKSGFAACFSDSGSDNEPLKSRKFFW